MSYSPNALHNRSFLCACVLSQGILKMTTMKVTGKPDTGFSFPQFEVISSFGLFNSRFSSLQSPILWKAQNFGVDHVSVWIQLFPLYVALRCWARLGLLSRTNLALVYGHLISPVHICKTRKVQKETNFFLCKLLYGTRK